MSPDDEFLWYKLFRADGFGPRAIHVIAEAIERSDLSLQQLFTMSGSEFQATFPTLGKGRLKRATLAALQSMDEDIVYEEYRSLKDNAFEIVYPGHELLPGTAGRLAEHGVSPILFCKGKLSLLKSPGIGIVGSRDASEEGKRIAKQFAAELALHGENVVSGYAKGIDTNAHLGALEKEGTTTIVLSLGILQFPKKKAFDKPDWEKNTLIVSQFHPMAGWNPANAMIRNKLVCVLSKALIVVESGREISEDGSRSGTFDAGKSALEMGIPLFVLSPSSFKKPPPGNKVLHNRGAIEIKRRDGIQAVLGHLETASTEPKERIATGEQLTLL